MPPAVSPFQQHLAPQHPPHQQQQLAQHPQHMPMNPFFPSLHLYPLNDSFVPKQIALAPQNGRVKIGRQTNAKTVPGERNGYFDSKVLSRQHAEIWEEGGKIYIKDVKSSNGTFINGERLSQEGVESDPFELKSDDTVEFGIDIVGEDNKTIIHHKVAAKVFCVFTPEDLQSLPIHHQGNRRVSLQSQLQANQAQNSALGGMGAPRVGKSGLTFDHILSRLQSELAKSRETGTELNQLTGTMVDIQDTLGGALPTNLPSYPPVLPPVRPPPDPAASTSQSDTALSTLQTQLHDTQSTLQSHLDKVRHLEACMAEQEVMKRDMSFLKEQIDERKREVEILLLQRRTEDEDHSRFSRRRDQPSKSVHQSVMEMDDDDDDDARSVATAVPDRDHGEEEEGDDERRRRTDELGRPRTPEPTGHMSDMEYEEERRMAHDAAREFSAQSSTDSSLKTSAVGNGHSVSGPSHPDLQEIFNQNAQLTQRLETLSAQLDSAMELSRTLQAQASTAQSTIADLESKVGTLETYVKEQREKAVTPPPPAAQDLEADDLLDEANTPEPPTHTEPVVTQRTWDEWRESVEGRWRAERETWDSERRRLAIAVKEWERRTVDLEKKEGERREKEEEAERRRLQRQDSTGFDSPSSDEDAEDVNHQDAGIAADGSFRGGISSLVNGFVPKKIGGRARRRKSLGKANGMPNGMTVLPSPISSPSSSISSSSAPPRRSDSPTMSEHHDHHPLVNGKLPISPPNTSPRSRPESLAPLADVEEESAEEPGDGESSLGLTNGGVSSSQSSLPSSAHDEKNRILTNSFATSAQAFSARNNFGKTGPTFSDAFGGYSLPYIGAATLAVIGAAVWSAVARERIGGMP